MNISQALNWRYATKQFDSSKKLSADQLDALLESLRLAPSSFGMQPWKFVVVKSPEVREKLKAAAWGQGQITEASDLIVLCRLEEYTTTHVDKNFENISTTRGVPAEVLAGYKDMVLGHAKGMSKEQMDAWMEKQVYIALGFLLETAALMEIDACPMEGFDPLAFDQILNLSAHNLKSVVVCPVGFRSTEDKTIAYKKVRFEKSQVIVEV